MLECQRFGAAWWMVVSLAFEAAACVHLQRDGGGPQHSSSVYHVAAWLDQKAAACCATKYTEMLNNHGESPAGCTTGLPDAEGQLSFVLLLAVADDWQ